MRTSALSTVLGGPAPCPYHGAQSTMLIPALIESCTTCTESPARGEVGRQLGNVSSRHRRGISWATAANRVQAGYNAEPGGPPDARRTAMASHNRCRWPARGNQMSTASACAGSAAAAGVVLVLGWCRCGAPGDCLPHGWRQMSHCACLRGYEHNTVPGNESAASLSAGAGPPQHALSSNKIALITSGCGATRSLGIKWP